MNKGTKICLGIIGAVVVLIILISLIPDNEPTPEPTTPTEIDPELDNKVLIISYLESEQGGDYNVLDVEVEHSNVLGNYVLVKMYSDDLELSQYDLASDETYMQLGLALGSLYGVWEDKDYYVVELTDYENICIYTMDGDIHSSYMNDEITAEEWFIHLTSTCVPL